MDKSNIHQAIWPQVFYRENGKYSFLKASFINNKNNNEMAEILMMYGERRKLAEKFSVSEVTVRAALKFRTRSNVANMIRKAALEMGGVLKGARTLREVIEKDENQSEN